MKNDRKREAMASFRKKQKDASKKFEEIKAELNQLAKEYVKNLEEKTNEEKL